ncbi:hypothetical protein HAX54_014802 [Datura stramonium]|uniref:Uncharacterized protein n=1 Tax=Datura stramonium TaxID=4076 RepID=A0ABS8TNP9_DATST|nr:hypothetical protein [Datura stramonium]
MSCNAFRSWRKDIAAVALAAKLSNETDKNHVSIPGLFSTAIEAMKDDPSETGYDMEKSPPDMRHVVCLEEQHQGSGGMKRKMTRKADTSASYGKPAGVDSVVN